jgi:hypothetical protein
VRRDFLMVILNAIRSAQDAPLSSAPGDMCGDFDIRSTFAV